MPANNLHKFRIYLPAVLVDIEHNTPITNILTIFAVMLNYTLIECIKLWAKINLNVTGATKKNKILATETTENQMINKLEKPKSESMKAKLK